VDSKIITKEDVKDFEKQLKDHQKAIGAEGMTVLEKALIEHNMQAISNIYMNISFE
jgi:COP9 signalosome complex subunit 4